MPVVSLLRRILRRIKISTGNGEPNPPMPPLPPLPPRPEATPKPPSK